MSNRYLPVALVLFLTTSCAKEPTQEYKLSAEQLAWQPYRTGDVLRFGQASTSKVRTFIIDEVDDRLQSELIGGGGIILFGTAKRVKTQSIDVRVRRTDTLRYAPTPTSTPTRPDSAIYTGTTSLLNIGADYELGIYAYVVWDIGFSNNLPLNEVINSLPLSDTTQRLLPTLRLGGVDYGPVLRISNSLRDTPYGFPRNKPARLIYYAKGYGVIGFVEGRTLWYRL